MRTSLVLKRLLRTSPRPPARPPSGDDDDLTRVDLYEDEDK